jgi:hypothetical protein
MQANRQMQEQMLRLQQMQAKIQAQQEPPPWFHAHRSHRDCYGDSRGTGKSLDLKRNIDINQQIMGARGASNLCTLIEARAADFNNGQRGDGISGAPAEPARRWTPRGRGASTAGARSSSPPDD